MTVVVLVFILTRPDPPAPTQWLDQRIDLISRLGEATAQGPKSELFTEAIGVAPAKGMRRTSLVLPAGGSVTFGSLEIPADATFRCSLAVPEFQKQPARFALYHLPDVGPPRMLQARTLPPRAKGWETAEVALNLPSGRLRLRLECREEGGGGVCFVAEPRIEAKVPSPAPPASPLRRPTLGENLISTFSTQAMIRAENPLDPLRVMPLPRRVARLLNAETDANWMVAAPTSEFQTRLFVPEEGFLEVEAIHVPRQRVTYRPGPRPELTFEIRIDGAPVWSRVTYEPDTPGPEGLLKDRIDLSRWSGRGVQVAFRTSRPDPLPNAKVLVGWTRLRLGRRIPVDYRYSSTERPNVIVLAVDGLRSDRVGSYGAQSELTPNLNAFSEGSRVYETAIAPAPWSVSTLASLMAGRYPHALGVLGLGKRSRLSGDELTLAEYLTTAGLRTGAFVPNDMASISLRDRGLDQGFATWVSFTNYPRRPRPKVTASELFQGLLDWADARPDEQFFAFLRCVDVSAPFAFDPEDRAKKGLLEPHVTDPKRDRIALWQRYDRILEKFDLRCECRRDDEGRLILPEKLEPLRAELERAYCPSEAEQQQLGERYDAGVVAWDRAFGQLVSELERRSYGRKTIVIVLGTHGEQLFEHGRLGSGQSLHEESIRMPLIVDGPGIEGRRIPDVVSLGGLFATVTGLLGLATPEGPDISAWPARGGGSKRPLAFSCLGNVSRGSGNTVAVRTAEWKLVRPAGDSSLDALYQIQSDPLESHDVSREANVILNSLGGELDTWWARRWERIQEDDEIVTAGRRE